MRLVWLLSSRLEAKVCVLIQNGPSKNTPISNASMAARKYQNKVELMKSASERIFVGCLATSIVLKEGGSLWL